MGEGVGRWMGHRKGTRSSSWPHVVPSKDSQKPPLLLDPGQFMRLLFHIFLLIIFLDWKCLHKIENF